jgi:hypothetical protein
MRFCQGLVREGKEPGKRREKRLFLMYDFSSSSNGPWILFGAASCDNRCPESEKFARSSFLLPCSCVWSSCGAQVGNKKNHLLARPGKLESVNLLGITLSSSSGPPGIRPLTRRRASGSSAGNLPPYPSKRHHVTLVRDLTIALDRFYGAHTLNLTAMSLHNRDQGLL